MKSLISALALLAVSAGASHATTYNIVGSFSGGQLGLVEFDVTIAADLSDFISDTSDELTVNQLSSGVAGDPFNVAGGLGFTYSPTLDRLYIGGLLPSVLTLSQTDFAFGINDFLASPHPGLVEDTYAGISGTARALEAAVAVSVVPSVPLPAGLLLLLSGIAGLAGFRRLPKKRAAQIRGQHVSACLSWPGLRDASFRPTA